MVICIFHGFTSGLPLYILIQLVPAWLRSEQIDLATIGLFSLVMLPYNLKFLWAPLLDRYQFPLLGRRRGWALLMQVALLISIALMGTFSPQLNLTAILWVVGATAFFSATQDVVLDAYRRELLSEDEFGTGNSLFVNAYRLSSLVPGSLALILSDHIPWASVFWVVAVFMSVGIITSLVIPESSDKALAPQSLGDAIIDPFVEFFTRDTLRSAFGILALMLLYKLGDNMAVALSTPFYLDLGFTRTQIGLIAKYSALWASIAGAAIGGIVMLKVSINRALWLFGFVQITSILGFAMLAHVGNSPLMLAVAVSFEYLGVGLGTVALTAFIARSASTRFTATQLALLTAITTLPRTLAGASTGFIVEAVGWFNFFLICALVAIPGMLLLLWVAPWNQPDSPLRDTAAAGLKGRK